MTGSAVGVHASPDVACAEGGGNPEVPLVSIVGPTAVGKTALSVRLAHGLAARFGGAEIINADSMQFYRGMDIGTAKATEAEREGVAHHLIDILDIEEEASVANFQAQARDLITRLRRSGVVPILVGGSGLYTRAALDELEFPGTDDAVRRRLERELAERGADALAQRLHSVDPVSAAKIRDERRLVRALEVHEVTGRPFSAFMPQRRYVSPHTLQLGIDAPRAVLRERAARRVDVMLEQGLEGEVATLAARGLAETRTASKAIGYRQYLGAAAGRISRAEAREGTITATNQFAKRQQTWFRADPRVTWFDFDDPALFDKALRAVVSPGSGLH